MSPHKNYIFTFPYEKDFYSYVDKGLKSLDNTIKNKVPCQFSKKIATAKGGIWGAKRTLRSLNS